jgi:hypothetical protein
MALTIPANGSTATTSSEATLSEITSNDLAYWGAMVFVPSAFTTGDTAVIKFYVWDINPTATSRIQYVKTISDSQASAPSFYIPLVPTTRYKLTIQRTAGTDRTFTWQIIKQTG